MAAVVQQVLAPISLTEYAQTMEEGSPTRVFVENLVAESDLLRAMPWLPATNGKRSFMDISSLPTTAFRGINAPGNESSGSFNLREEDTFYIDEYIKVDRALVDRLGMQHRYRQEKLKTTALSQMCTAQFIKGDNGANPSSPAGLQARCTSLGYNLIHNSTASGGAALSLGNLDLLMWTVNKPSHWLFPRGLMPFMDIAARNNTLVNQTVAYTEDDFGRKIMKYKGLPILFGYEPDDSPDMLPFTEVAVGGGAATAASIYCLNLRDGGVYGIEQTPLNVIDEGPLQGIPFYSTHIKWDWGIAREHPRAVARLDSITATNIVA